jgi:hypothetical protein
MEFIALNLKEGTIRKELPLQKQTNKLNVNILCF